MDGITQSQTNELFNGHQLDPQFAIALKDFLSKNTYQFAYVPVRATGSVSCPNAAGVTVAKAVAHGLGKIPNSVNIYFFPGGSAPSGFNFFAWLSTSTAMDATNFYLDFYGNTQTVYWIASA